MAMIRRTRYGPRTMRPRRRRNLSWVGVQTANFTNTVTPSSAILASILNPSTTQYNRMNTATLIRLVGELFVWLPYTSAPSGTITAGFLMGIKVGDNFSGTNVPPPDFDSTDDWLIWRGGTLQVNSNDGSNSAIRYPLDIKTKRRMEPIADQLYFSIVNTTPAGGSNVAFRFVLRALLLEH